jgi:hypothetical protein
MRKSLICSLALIIALFAYAEQKTLADLEINYTGGGKKCIPNSAEPVNWDSPDYWNGMAYFRVEMKNKPDDHPIGFQFCVWSNGFSKEMCSHYRSWTVTQNGVHYYKESPSAWWKKAKPEWNALTERCFIIKDAANDKWLGCSAGGHCTSGGGHIPFDVRMTLHMVTSDDQFNLDWDCPWPECTGGKVGATGMEPVKRREVSLFNLSASPQTITVDISSRKPFRVEIVDCRGRVVYTRVLSMQSKVRIEKSRFAAGMNAVKVVAGKHTATRRIAVW